MNKPYKGGTKVRVQGLDIYLPKKPKRELIANHGLTPKKQKWNRTPLPKDWEERREDEEFVKMTNPNHRDPVLEAFRKQEGERRLNGYWFFNKGKATYITGPNYYYLNWCRFDHEENDGYPLYYDYTRSLFYFRQYCAEDPRCLGYLVIGPRGTGKSSEEVACILESMTRLPRRRQAAIQSKSEDDAKQKIFKEKMVEVYKALPDFFKPISNHGSNPEGKLSFFRDTVKGRKAKQVTYSAEEELANVIYPVTAKVKSLDGGTYSEILNDEIGKTDPKREADVYERQAVNRFCVFRNNRKRGMIRATTTVEEMDKGGKECRLIWDESDIDERTENGFTISGLYRFFISAIDAGTQFADDYGYIDRAKAQRFHEIERNARDGNSKSSYMRKNPFTPKEAFMVDGEMCAFNSLILNERDSFLNLNVNVTNRGDFERVESGLEGRVEFRPNKNGAFEVAWLFPTGEESNKITEIAPASINETMTRRYRPDNESKFVIGTDPVDHSQTVDASSSSKAAAYVFRKYDHLVDNGKDTRDWETYNFVVQYIRRPKESVEYYEQMINLCVFFGCQILVENQKVGIINHFRLRGYERFIMNRPDNTKTVQGNSQNTPGAPSSTHMIQQYTDLLETFIEFHGHRLFFRKLVEDLLKFDPKNTKEHDPSVAAGFTLIGSNKTVKKAMQTVGAKKYFHRYNNKGNRSKKIA